MSNLIKAVKTSVQKKNMIFNGLGVSSAVVALGLLVHSAPLQAEFRLSIGVPAPVEVYEPPAGYRGCYNVSERLDGKVWSNQYRVCEYKHHPRGNAWVSGHWVCQHYRHGHCRSDSWQWVQGHWESTYREEWRDRWDDGDRWERRYHRHHRDEDDARDVLDFLFHFR